MRDLKLAAQRMRIAFELHEAGVRMYRQKCRRENPDADEATIDGMVKKWLRTRPGAEHGDVCPSVSRVVELP